MDVGLRRPPGQPGKMQVGVDVAERTWRQVVDIVGKDANGIGVTIRTSHSCLIQDVGHRRDEGADDGERIRRLRVDVRVEQIADLLQHIGHGSAKELRVLGRQLRAESFGERALCPRWKPLGQAGTECFGVCGESGVVRR